MVSLHYELPSGPKLNLGCGPVQPSGWINIDGSNRAFIASKLNLLDSLLVYLGILSPTEFNKSTKYHNLLKGLPYRNNEISCIYAGELWEHFTYEDAFALTGECYRVIKARGVLRICVPDGIDFFKNYLSIFDEEAKKTPELRQVSRLKDHVQMFFDDICTQKLYLGSIGHTHKWVYDELQLIEMLEVNGFTNVERMKFHISRIPDINSVERSDFLIIEGTKN
jgi:predicted SAM-dependent methyltransferase